MKLCINCVHYRRAQFFPDADKCVRVAPIDPVRGTPGNAPHCWGERQIGGRCGPDGAHYESRLLKELEKSDKEVAT